MIGIDCGAPIQILNRLRGRPGPARRAAANEPFRDGWVARTHFSHAAAALWLEGEFVHLEDLVLHDAGMDISIPTSELTRARQTGAGQFPLFNGIAVR